MTRKCSAENYISESRVSKILQTTSKHTAVKCTVYFKNKARINILGLLSHAVLTVMFWCQARRCLYVPNMSENVPSHSQETRTWHFSHWLWFADKRGNWSGKWDWVWALGEGGRRQEFEWNPLQKDWRKDSPRPAWMRMDLTWQIRKNSSLSEHCPCSDTDSSRNASDNIAGKRIQHRSQMRCIPMSNTA